MEQNNITLYQITTLLKISEVLVKEVQLIDNESGSSYPIYREPTKYIRNYKKIRTGSGILAIMKVQTPYLFPTPHSKKPGNMVKRTTPPSSENTHATLLFSLIYLG